MGTSAAAPLLAVVEYWPRDAATLTRLDPMTLRPTGARVTLPEYHWNWSFSPDGSRDVGILSSPLGSGGLPR